MPKAKIICADVLEGLRSLEDESVQCCISSPPYWGLRDYGTAAWEGGDPACDHKRVDKAGVSSSGLEGGKGNVHHGHEAHYTNACAKCGASRVDDQIGIEDTPEEYVEKLVKVFREVWRVLRPDGICFLNLGDSYCQTDKWGGGKNLNAGKHTVAGNGTVPSWEARRIKRPRIPGIKPKDLVGIPWRVAFALQSDGADLGALRGIERAREALLEEYDGEVVPDRVIAVLEKLENEYREAKGGSWYLRSDIIWFKANPMPESATDRPTKAHEYIFVLTKSARYLWDQEAVRERGTEESLKRLARADHRTKVGYDEAHFGNPPIRARRRRDENIGSDRATGDDTGFEGGLLRGTKERDSGGGRSGTRNGERDGGNRVRRATLPHRERESHEGFNERWDGSATRNIRSVWNIATSPFPGEFCTSCKRFYVDGGRHLAKHRDEETEKETKICACGRWDSWISHFACFPQTLVEPMIKAGSSEKGCCPECGAPRERVVERKAAERDDSGRTHSLPEQRMGKTPPPEKGWESERRTIGFRSTCDCEAGDPVPCTVLDPFAGAGTTGLVALKLGRDFVGVELNPDYAEMARKRIYQDAPLFNEVELSNRS